MVALFFNILHLILSIYRNFHARAIKGKCQFWKRKRKMSINARCICVRICYQNTDVEACDHRKVYHRWTKDAQFQADCSGCSKWVQRRESWINPVERHMPVFIIHRCNSESERRTRVPLLKASAECADVSAVWGLEIGDQWDPVRSFFDPLTWQNYRVELRHLW